MSNRSWFLAVDGKQHGPYPETQFRDLMARGMVTAQTLVWTEGMAAWQPAGDIPGLPGSGATSTTLRRAATGMAAGALRPSAAAVASGAGQTGSTLSFEPELWPLFGYIALYAVGLAVVIPSPWTSTTFYRWLVPHIRVPGRVDLEFTGHVGDIWYVFVGIGLVNVASGFLSFIPGIQLLAMAGSAFLGWMILRWLAGNLNSGGQHLPIAFDGNPLHYVGWFMLCVISSITIIGWAWVLVFWMQWICRNISGTRRAITFIATPVEVLWRGLVFGIGCVLGLALSSQLLAYFGWLGFAIGCVFLIPIPWLLHWYLRWFVAQFALSNRSAR